MPRESPLHGGLGNVYPPPKITTKQSLSPSKFNLGWRPMSLFRFSTEHGRGIMDSRAGDPKADTRRTSSHSVHIQRGEPVAHGQIDGAPSAH